MADSLLSLCWKDYSSALAAECKTLLDNDFLVDCTLVAEGQTLKAHRLILSACSPYFHMLFSGIRDKHPIVILKDTLFNTLKAIIGFVYHGEAQIPQGQLETFLELAKSLQIKGLRQFHLEDRNKNSDGSGKDAPPCPPGVNKDASEVYDSNASREDDSRNSSRQQRRRHSKDHARAVQVNPSVPFERCSDSHEKVQSVSMAQEQQVSPERDEVLIDTEIIVKHEPLFTVFSDTEYEVLDNVECDKSMSEVNEEITLPYREQDLIQYLSASESSHGNVELTSVAQKPRQRRRQRKQVTQLRNEPSSEPAVEPDPVGPVFSMPESAQMEEAATEELINVDDEPENNTSDGAEASNLISTAPVQKWSYQEVQEKVLELTGDSNTVNIFKDEQIDGSTLLELTEADLKEMKLRMGPMKHIMKFLKEVRGKKMENGKVINYETEPATAAAVALPRQPVYVHHNLEIGYSGFSRRDSLKEVLRAHNQGERILKAVTEGPVSESDRRCLVRIVVSELVATTGTHYPLDICKTALAKAIVEEFPLLKDNTSGCLGYEHYFDPNARVGFIEFRLMTMRKHLSPAQKKYAKAAVRNSLNPLMRCRGPAVKRPSSEAPTPDSKRSNSDD